MYGWKDNNTNFHCYSGGVQHNMHNFVLHKLVTQKANNWNKQTKNTEISSQNRSPNSCFHKENQVMSQKLSEKCILQNTNIPILLIHKS